MILRVTLFGHGSAADSNEFVVGCFTHSCSPAAMFVAKQVTALRDRGDASFASFFVMDTNTEEGAARASELGITALPAVCFWYHGRQLTVRRPGYTDASQCTSLEERQRDRALPTACCMHTVLHAPHLLLLMYAAVCVCARARMCVVRL